MQEGSRTAILAAFSANLGIAVAKFVGFVLTASAGLLLALGGVVTAHVAHDPRWDVVGSISIGLLLVAIAAVLAIEMKGLLIGEGASAETDELIRSALGGAPHVTKLIHLRGAVPIARLVHLEPDIARA